MQLNSSFIKDKQKKDQELNYINDLISKIEFDHNCKEELEKQKNFIIEKLKNFNTIKFNIVNSFIDYIEIGEKDKQNNIQDIVIHWNF